MKRSFLISLAVLTVASSAGASPTLRRKVDVRGDLVVIGNTLGYDCGSSVAAPTGATRTCTGVLDTDTGSDGYWTDNAGAPTLVSTNAATSAQLDIPAGRRIVYARLYWSAILSGLLVPPDADLTVRVRPPGATTDTTFTAVATETNRITTTGPLSPAVPYSVYQSSVDVTTFVATHRSGAYRVTDVESILLNGIGSETAYSGWTLVVAYEDVDLPYRQISIFDGLDELSGTTTATAAFSGFALRATPGALLTVWGYEGDHALTGDSVKFNGTTVSNALNPANDFFNSSRTHLGVAVAGAVPAISGVPNSMAGFDLDTVNVSSLLTTGSTTANAEVAGSSADSVWLGGIIGAIESKAPLITATKTFVDLNGGAPLAGETLEFTITATNDGDDTATNVVINDPLPSGLSFVPGSIKVNGAAVTDAAADDRGEYIASSTTVTARVGTGATAIAGGTLAVGETATLTFRATISGAPGTVLNQGAVRAGGALGMPPTDFPTDGDPVTPGRQGTPIVIKECDTSGGCVAPKVCNPTTNTCVDPTADAGVDGGSGDGGGTDSGLLDGALDSALLDGALDSALLDTSILDGAGDAGDDSSVADSASEDTGLVADTGSAIDGSIVSDGGGAADGSVDDPSAFVAEGGGCGCRTTSRVNSSAAPLTALAIALLFMRRKR